MTTGNMTGYCPNPEPYLTLLHITPPQTVCPNFYILDHARGCNFNCDYCFLRDIEYNRKERRLFSDIGRMQKEIIEWVAEDGLETCLANAGNMTDALSFEKERPVWGMLIETMREHATGKGRPHCLLVVTKAGLDMCGAFLEHAPCPNVIVSFSINDPGAARDHEPGAASSEQRLEAARKLQSLGWRVRVRMDPMIAGYDYAPLAREIAAFAPERVTLGTLRADPTLLPEVRDVPMFTRLEEPEPKSIARYPRALRMEMYRTVVDILRDRTSIGLCEETEDVWRDLGLDYVNKTCNCNPL